MNSLDWQQILLECKTTIQIAIQPLLATIRDPQPNLGMGAGGDFMKPVDLAAENAIVQTLLNHGVSFTLVSEESGIKEYGTDPKSCYICADPIDGTTNLIRGLPFYCSSIAVSSTPDLEGVYTGTVIDLVHNEVFYAAKGKGAYRDGQRIYTTKTQSLDEAVVGMDLNAYKAKLNMTIAANVIENVKHTRHFGANALEVSHVAAGLTDVFIDIRNKIRTTDVAAGFLIAKEAGATVTDPDNNPINVPLDPRQRLNFICSTNKEIHKQILSLIKS